MKSKVGLCVFLLIQLCSTQSGLAQQWFSPHSTPVFRGTDAQDLTLKAMDSQNECRQRLNQLSIALFAYAADNGGHYPKDWQACESEIGDPYSLTCPASPYQFSGTNWSAFDFSKASYTLIPGVTDANPDSVCIVCNYHGNYALGDGGSHSAKPYAQFPAVKKGSIYIPLPALAAAKKRADVIFCVNNLKQIGDACRIYSSYNGNRCPTNFAVMETELGSLQVLYCPAIDITAIPTNFSQVDYSQISYTMPSTPPENTGDVPQISCRYHGSFCLPDGSVQVGTNAYTYPGIIVGSPISQTVDPGATATLMVLLANPSETVSFQWRKQQPFDSMGEAFTNTVVITGATNATLNLTNCTSADEGYYDVVVSIPSGLKETSAMSYLAVAPMSSIPLNRPLDDLCCRNNLKQILLTANVATEAQQFPTNKAIYSSILGWPMSLFCPSDFLRTPPETWDSFELSDSSYIIDSNVSLDVATNIVASCKVHHLSIQADGQIVSTELRIVGISLSGDSKILNWTGGAAPYQVQMTTSLTNMGWTTVADSISGNSLALPDTNATAFYRVVYQLP